MEKSDLEGYLRLWPEIITPKEVLTRAVAVISPEYCSAICPEINALIERRNYMPTLRNVAAQVMSIESSLLGAEISDNEKLGEILGMKNPLNRKNVEAFSGAYLTFCTDIMTADEEVYRRKIGISLDEIKEMQDKLTLLWGAFEGGDIAQFAKYADLLEQDAEGNKLADSLVSECITGGVYSLMAKKTMLILTDESVTSKTAYCLGVLYAHSRYRNILPFIRDSLHLPIEYEAKQ